MIPTGMSFAPAAAQMCRCFLAFSNICVNLADVHVEYSHAIDCYDGCGDSWVIHICLVSLWVASLFACQHFLRCFLIDVRLFVLLSARSETSR